MPQFSIITAFRNRDAQRVKNSLNSLAKQTIQDFELIFVDYGSDAAVSKTIKSIVKNYSFAKYVFNNTRGWFWSRSHALNTGIKLASGQLTLLWDIDLIVELDFLEKLGQQNFQDKFTTHRCYYLPPEANNQNYKSSEILKNSQHSYVGLCCVQTKIVNKIGGFDEFFQVWGAEDDDLYNRLQLEGLERQQIDATQVPVYHQWHPSQSPALPDMWYLKMVEHLFTPNREKDSCFGEILNMDKRPALQIYKSRIYSQLQEIRLGSNKTLLFNELIKEFKNNTNTKGFYIDYKYPQLEFSGKAQKIMSKFNQFMEARNRNFRLINKKQQERNKLKENIYAFLKYFIGINRNEINDYYLDWRNDGFVLIVDKK